VPDRRDLVHARAVAALVQRGQDLRVPLVAEPVQLGQELACPALVEAVVRGERAQRLEVDVEPPRVLVEPCDVAAAQLDGRVLPAEEAVARELDLEADPSAALRIPGDDGVVVMAVQALRGAAVEPEGGLAVGIPEQVDAAAGPCLGDGRRTPEPVGRPERPETLAERRRPVLELLRLVAGDPVDGAGDEQLFERARLRVDERSEALRRLREPTARVPGVPDQTARPSRLSPVSGLK
jgi:hypothetical protein